MTFYMTKASKLQNCLNRKTRCLAEKVLIGNDLYDDLHRVNRTSISSHPILSLHHTYEHDNNRAMPAASRLILSTLSTLSIYSGTDGWMVIQYPKAAAESGTEPNITSLCPQALQIQASFSTTLPSPYLPKYLGQVGRITQYPY